MYVRVKVTQILIMYSDKSYKLYKVSWVLLFFAELPFLPLFGMLSLGTFQSLCMECACLGHLSVLLLWAWDTRSRRTPPGAGTVVAASTGHPRDSNWPVRNEKDSSGQAQHEVLHLNLSSLWGGSRATPLYRWTKRFRVGSQLLTCSGGRGNPGKPAFWVIRAGNHLQTESWVAARLHV